MPAATTYEILSRSEITRAANRWFTVPVGTNTLYELSGSRRTASEIIAAVRKFDRDNSNRGDWETILQLILKNRADIQALLSQF